MSATEAPSEIFASEESAIPEVAAAVVATTDQIEHLTTMRQFALSFLFEKIGRDMLAKGQRTKIIDGFRYYCDPPRIKEFCGCHSALLYQCPNDPADRPSVFTRLESRPSFWVRQLKEAKND